MKNPSSPIPPFPSGQRRKRICHLPPSGASASSSGARGCKLVVHDSEQQPHPPTHDETSSRSSDPIPIIVVMKAMGIETDQEVVQMVGRDPRYADLLYLSIQECATERIYTQQQGRSVKINPP
ncbi:hypothetical protein ZWY2020_020521 [Hordeum vulgare]|nr:hypothetical protein ZWY2020_020521 [Hordeum vulgare]